MARNSPEKSSPLRWSRLLAVPLARHAATVLIALAVLVGIGTAAWQQWGPAIVRSPQFLLNENDFEVTPQPAWIHASVKRDAIRAGGLTNLSVLDPKLIDKVEQAFKVHTWVAAVRRVVKHHPARVVVEVEYRRPVAMVEIAQGDQRGLLPVDATGVLLPPEDFAAAQVKSFLRVSIPATQPQGPVGTAWGDARVTGAAKIAAELGDTWQKLQLYRIVHTGDDGVGAPQFDLVTRDAKVIKVIWGHAPGQEVSGEATASEKIAQLEAWHTKNGALTASTDKHDLNVRDGKRTGTVAVPPVPAKADKTMARPTSQKKP